MSQLKFNRMVWQTFRLLFTIALFIVAATPSARADNSLTLQASTTLLNHDTGDAPEHVYVIRNIQKKNISNHQKGPLYWQADLLPSDDSRDNAYYIYDLSAEQWLTYTVPDSYDTFVKGQGTKSFVGLSSDRNDAAYFVFETNKRGGNSGYQILPVTTEGEVHTNRWYLNYFGGYDKNINETIGLYGHDGSQDDGSLWLLETPPSSTSIATADTEPSNDLMARLTPVFQLHNGYGWGVNDQLQPSMSGVGHYVFYKATDAEGAEDAANAYYIFDYTLGKWLDYNPEDINIRENPVVGEDGAKDFISLSEERGHYFNFTSCSKSGISGYQIRLYTSSGKVSKAYLNFFKGFQENVGHRLGYYWHDGNRDFGSLWRLDSVDPDPVTISELGTANKFAFHGDVQVTLNPRTLQAGVWNTFCVPFHVSADSIARVLGSDCKVRQFDHMDTDGTTMVFTKVTAIQAGVPYLVKPAKDVAAPKFVPYAILEQTPQTIEHGGYKMVGTYGTATLATDGTNLFLTAKNTFTRPKDDGRGNYNILRGLRAYFVVPTTADATALRISVDGTTTGVGAIDTPDASAGAAVYNLQGQRVGTSLDSLPRGVYIQQGKKYIVK